MSVDRAGRDVAAEILAAFMRGEVDDLDAKSKLDQITGFTGDQDLDSFDDVKGDLALFMAGRHVQPLYIEICEPEWERLRVHLAFLLTDLEYPQIDNRQEDAARIRRTQCIAAIHLLALVTATIAGYWLGWWLPIVAVPLSAILFWVPPFLYQGTSRESDLSFPFASEAQRLTYEEMLEKFDLPPTYEESVFPSQRLPPLRYTLSERIEIWEEYAGCAAIVMGIVILWPIILVMWVCSPPDPAPGDATAEPEG